MKDKTIILFTTPTCAACKTLKPYLAEAKAKGVKIKEVDLEANPKDAARNGISTVPTMFFMEGAKMRYPVVGAGQNAIDKIREFSNER